MRNEMSEVPKEKHTRTSVRPIDLLVRFPLFDGLDKNELRLVGKHMRYIRVKPNRYIFREGEESSYLCFVADGEFEVLKDGRKGVTTCISTLRAGDSIGETSLIDYQLRPVSMRAKTRGVVFTFSRGSFDVLLDHHPHTGTKILQAIARLLSVNNLPTSSTELVGKLLECPKCSHEFHPKKQAVEKDRREHPRKNCLVRADFASENRIHRGTIKNFGKGGALVESTDAFWVGERLTMIFERPDTQERVKIFGEVVRIARQEVGIQFNKTLNPNIPFKKDVSLLRRQKKCST
jgi:CRP-like cAMP-binding protein/Tfp pilus assembly protein PilZ